MSLCTHPTSHDLSANLSVLVQAASKQASQHGVSCDSDKKQRHRQLPLNSKPPPASAASIEQAHAALLRQLLEGQPSVVSAPPAVESAAADVNHLLQTLLANAMVSNCLQQPNQPVVTMDLLRLLGNTQPPPPPKLPAIQKSVTPPVATNEPSPISKQAKDIPGLKRVSCRARGMPPDHCSESAYLWIHPGLPHGADLLCSYPACRASGVKFRYCKFCKVPAAKRSFLFRHGHMKHCESTGSASPHSASDTEVSVSDAPKKPLSTKPQTLAEMVSDDSEQGNTSCHPISKKRRAVSQDPEDVSCSEAWRKLLYERPKEGDEDGMSKWLLRVMQVSRTIKKGKVQPSSTV